MLEKTKRYARKLGLTDKIFFPGQLSREEIIDLYLKCQIAVIPSNVETFGYCICEALSLGCVVISRKTGLASQYLIDGENGFLFETEDELLAKLLQVADSPRTKLTTISTLAIEVSRIFKWEDIVKAHMQYIFRPIMTKKRRE